MAHHLIAPKSIKSLRRRSSRTRCGGLRPTRRYARWVVDGAQAAHERMVARYSVAGQVAILENIGFFLVKNASVDDVALP
jgi:hypothetical protein